MPGRIQDREGQHVLADCCENISGPLEWPGSDVRGSPPNPALSLPSLPLHLPLFCILLLPI